MTTLLLVVIFILSDTLAGYLVYRRFQKQKSALAFASERISNLEEAAGQEYLKVEALEGVFKVLEANEKTWIKVMSKQEERIKGLEKRLRVKGK
jgi:hypothetical protein